MLYIMLNFEALQPDASNTGFNLPHLHLAPHRVTRYDRDIDMRYRYGISIWDIGQQWDIDRDVDLRYGLSMWDMVY